MRWSLPLIVMLMLSGCTDTDPQGDAALESTQTTPPEPTPTVTPTPSSEPESTAEPEPAEDEARIESDPARPAQFQSTYLYVEGDLDVDCDSPAWEWDVRDGEGRQVARPEGRGSTIHMRFTPYEMAEYTASVAIGCEGGATLLFQLHGGRIANPDRTLTRNVNVDHQDPAYQDPRAGQDDSCPDADGDGVCNGADQCPGSNDHDPACDGVCGVTVNVAMSRGAVADPDCDGKCDTADMAMSADCNGVCNVNDIAGSPDCNGHCDAGDFAGSPDCDGTCDAGDAAFGPDCPCPPLTRSSIRTRTCLQPLAVNPLAPAAA